ncbi:MAG: TatD family hydrolase [Bacilli bacterium]|jgi:TatD DNase family protein|nr:TatD family hydrolase [Bacilli bacterium]
MIIDTHMHIFDDRYQGIIDEVVAEAKANNVGLMIAVGYDYESSLKAIELAHKYDCIYASVGLHPSEVVKEKDKSLEWLESLLHENKVIAIGEIGLDYYWDQSFKELQKELFAKQIGLAKANNLPIIVHNREATQDCFTILKQNLVPGVMHCYSSSVEMAHEFTKLGYYLGIGGVVTFKNSKEIKKVVKDIDIQYLLSETDSPYLAPMPYRGKMNRPAYTKYVVEEIAKIKETDLAMVEEALASNAQSLFKF